MENSQLPGKPPFCFQYSLGSEMDGSPYGMEDDMMGDMDEYGQEGEEGDPMDGSGQYGQEGEYGDENVSYNLTPIQTL
jgi:hypothetical protein